MCYFYVMDFAFLIGSMPALGLISYPHATDLWNLKKLCSIPMLSNMIMQIDLIRGHVMLPLLIQPKGRMFVEVLFTGTDWWKRICPGRIIIRF